MREAGLLEDQDRAAVLLAPAQRLRDGHVGAGVRAVAREAGARVVAESAPGYGCALRRGLADARADFLQKPVMPEQLLRKLRGSEGQYERLRRELLEATPATFGELADAIDADAPLSTPLSPCPPLTRNLSLQLLTKPYEPA